MSWTSGGDRLTLQSNNDLHLHVAWATTSFRWNPIDNLIRSATSHVLQWTQLEAWILRRYSSC